MARIEDKWSKRIKERQPRQENGSRGRKQGGIVNKGNDVGERGKGERCGVEEWGTISYN